MVWHLETYDVTSIRASTPMYFLSKAITDLGIKVVLSGEGADEIFGGYLYFRNAPSTVDFQKETIERVQKLFMNKPYGLSFIVTDETFGVATIVPNLSASCRIEVSDFCTVLNNDQFYSYRKENGKTGRMYALIGVWI